MLSVVSGRICPIWPTSQSTTRPPRRYASTRVPLFDHHAARGWRRRQVNGYLARPECFSSSSRRRRGTHAPAREGAARPWRARASGDQSVPAGARGRLDRRRHRCSSHTVHGAEWPAERGRAVRRRTTGAAEIFGSTAPNATGCAYSMSKRANRCHPHVLRAARHPARSNKPRRGCYGRATTPRSTPRPGRLRSS